MFGLPGWLWAIIGALVMMAALLRSFYSRFRRRCESVRRELTEVLGNERPDLELAGERMGDLVLRLPDGSERVWEMAGIYSAVAQTPGMGRDLSARSRVYRSALQELYASLPTDTSTLTWTSHRGRIRPLLMRPEAVSQLTPGAELLHTPIAALGLEVVYLLDSPERGRYLTGDDRKDLDVDSVALHQAALENLGQNFPPETLAGPLEDDAGSAVQLGDSFDATRLLLIPGKLPEGKELIALAPHRDMLLLLPASLRNDPEALRESAGMLECSGHPSLLDRPVLVTRSGFELI